MPGHKVFLQDGGEIREGLTCCYCRLVLKNPVQTNESGQRLCRGCFEEASKNAVNLDPRDEIWADSAVKREIDNLEVKCENYKVGCEWKGLFKQLMQHSQQCQYVTVECRNPGCGQRVLLTKIEEHLKQECPQRLVKCKDCGKEMYFIELKNHGGECPNVPKTCKNCNKKIPASKLADHMIRECKHVRCVCKNDGKTYEAGSTKFHSHLQDVSKLADHLGPMICEFTKMSEAFKEMNIAYQQATERIDAMEKRHQEDVRRIMMLENYQNYAQIVETLEKRHQEDVQKIEMLEKNCRGNSQRIEMLEKKNDLLHIQVVQLNETFQNKSDYIAQVCDGYYDSMNRMQGVFWRVENDMEDHKNRMDEIEKRLRRDRYDFLTHQLDINTAAVTPSNDKMVFHENRSSEVKQLEEKVLEVERTLNVISVHHSELELQLQASLASTYNGSFLWRIPEVRQRIQDARTGLITSIYSPPFYTGRNGYKMCIRAYLNGDGTGEKTHLSIFFVLMKGEYDPLLQWPFESKVSLILVDQDHKKHLVQTFKPNTRSCSFQKPKTDMNVASGCPEFADLSILDNTTYVKDDVMYIKAIVDTSKIFHP